MKFLIIQENGRHTENRHFRECFCLQRSLIKLGYVCDVWGLGHDNFAAIPSFNTYDVTIDLENYDTGWVPDLSFVSSYKVIWSIDAHCQGIDYYINKFVNNKCQLILQATKDYLNKNSVWFPNCFDNGLIYPKPSIKRADVGFCGNICNRKAYFDFLKLNFNFVTDFFVIGDEMVNAINSYKIHFNKNLSNDINYRNFETIGCGIPLVTSYNYQYEELGFKDKANCCFYNNTNELLDIIESLLSDNRLLNQIANNGYELSKKHNYDIRAGQLIEILEKRI